jgi:CopG family nickel-responsive transcriptional regulator
MTGELVRFGVAMDAALLARFDEHLGRRGYATRSEALRDLVRAELASAHVAEGGMAAGTLTLVYDHHVRELTEKLTDMQHDLGDKVVSMLHVHLDHDHCLEVIVLRGPAVALQSAADRILATRGVQHGQLVLTALPSVSGHPEHPPSEHPPSEPSHPHDHHDHHHERHGSG